MRSFNDYCCCSVVIIDYVLITPFTRFAVGTLFVVTVATGPLLFGTICPVVRYMPLLFVPLPGAHLLHDALLRYRVDAFIVLGVRVRPGLPFYTLTRLFVCLPLRWVHRCRLYLLPLLFVVFITLVRWVVLVGVCRWCYYELPRLRFRCWLRCLRLPFPFTVDSIAVPRFALHVTPRWLPLPAGDLPIAVFRCACRFRFRLLRFDYWDLLLFPFIYRCWNVWLPTFVRSVTLPAFPVLIYVVVWLLDVTLFRVTARLFVGVPHYHRYVTTLLHVTPRYALLIQCWCLFWVLYTLLFCCCSLLLFVVGAVVRYPFITLPFCWWVITRLHCSPLCNCLTLLLLLMLRNVVDDTLFVTFYRFTFTELLLPTIVDVLIVGDCWLMRCCYPCCCVLLFVVTLFVDNYIVCCTLLFWYPIDLPFCC